MPFKYLISRVIFALSFVISLPAIASEESSTEGGLITEIISYSDYGTADSAGNKGDVWVSLAVNGASCSYGYYIHKAQGGYDSNLSMLLAAYHAKTPIKIRGNVGELWVGSNSETHPACEVNSVQYRK